MTWSIAETGFRMGAARRGDRAVAVRGVIRRVETTVLRLALCHEVVSAPLTFASSSNTTSIVSLSLVGQPCLAAGMTALNCVWEIVG